MTTEDMRTDGVAIEGIRIEGSRIEGMAGIVGNVNPANHFFRGVGGRISLFVPPQKDRAARCAGATGTAGAAGFAAGFLRAGDASSLIRRSTSGPSRLSAAMM